MSDNPTLTIGVPTYNRGWSLPGLLRAIEVLEYPKKSIRLVFVDNCSNDDTPTLLEEFKKHSEAEYENILVISQRTNIPEARNLCVDNSIGEYILFVDSDTLPPADAISHLMAVLKSNPGVAIVGLPYPMKSPLTDRHSERASPQGFLSMFVLSFGCAMIRTKLLNLIGPFNPRWDRGEDYELTMRARIAGFGALLDPTRSAVHLREPTPREASPNILSDIKYVIKDLAKQASRFLSDLELATYTGSTYTEIDIFPRQLRSAKIIGIVIWKSTLLPLLWVSYAGVVALRIPRETGAWRNINPVFFPLYGLRIIVPLTKEVLGGGLELSEA